MPNYQRGLEHLTGPTSRIRPQRRKSHCCKRDELLKKLGAVQHQTLSAWRLVTVKADEKEARFTYQLHKDKLRTVRRREGSYLLCCNLTRGGGANE
jgi:hypothetical protein